MAVWVNETHAHADILTYWVDIFECTVRMVVSLVMLALCGGGIALLARYVPNPLAQAAIIALGIVVLYELIAIPAAGLGIVLRYTDIRYLRKKLREAGKK